MVESEAKAKPYNTYANFVKREPITADEIPLLWDTIENKPDKAEAQYRLAVAYLKGEGGVQEDFGKAIDYMRQAARSNHHLALYNMTLFWFKYGDDTLEEFTGFVEAWHRLERCLDIADFIPARFLQAQLLYMYPEHAERLPDYRHLQPESRSARIRHDAEEAMIEAARAGFNPARLALGDVLINTAAVEGMPMAIPVNAALQNLFHRNPVDLIRTIAYAPKTEAGR